MEHTALVYVLLGIFLSITAESVISSPDVNGPQRSQGVAANFNENKPVREAVLLQLADFVKRVDTLLKERLQYSYDGLKEQLQQADAIVKERMLEGEAHIKEQVKTGDSRLKEELEEDVAWLTNKITKVQSLLQSELAVQERKVNEQLSERKGISEELKKSGQKYSDMSSALTEDLNQQVRDLQAQMNTTKDLLQTTQTEVARSQQSLQFLQNAVHSLVTNETVNDNGSTYTRWGSTTCPDNTSLVYAGVAGGSWWDHSGGASNYLCLVMNPQLDNDTAVPNSINYLYGVEYEQTARRHNQDVVCSVCRAPQATTIMIPATLTCPVGWTPQYKGYLMSERYTQKGRTEYVCVDEEREYRPGGQADKEGAIFYHVATSCGSLPCPPYVHRKVVTCVVCSM